MIVVGDEIVKSDALEAAAAFAETLGAPVYQQSVAYGAHFLSEHACYMGGLSRDQSQVRGVLSKYDLMIVLGADPVRMSVWSEVEPLPEGMPVVHIGLVDWDMGKNFAAEMARARRPARDAAGARRRCWQSRRRAPGRRAPRARWRWLAKATGRPSAPAWSSASRAATSERRSIPTG